MSKGIAGKRIHVPLGALALRRRTKLDFLSQASRNDGDKRVALEKQLDKATTKWKKLRKLAKLLDRHDQGSPYYLLVLVQCAGCRRGTPQRQTSRRPSASFLLIVVNAGSSGLEVAVQVAQSTNASGRFRRGDPADSGTGTYACACWPWTLGSPQPWPNRRWLQSSRDADDVVDRQAFHLSPTTFPQEKHRTGMI
ncbi:hypothetical protein NUW54_g14560 [Trametes sanguinea]|uniref:Uncharacterized protein n=1 Tax=Trametes sanguinea TaxID=158606 RepID=A0ACC1MDL2_9APHY|nr:hypothetical protein NUW54_g14560 [Trametes sanguinea]